MQRERLFGVLDDAHRSALIWMAAPPGSGKTSLVTSYLGERQRPVAWMQVDTGDADPATFFHYLSLAAASIVENPPPLPIFTPQDAVNPAQFARRYFREWFAMAVVGTVLVLDNIQEAGDLPSWNAILAAMVEETPAGIQSIALSRTGLPFELTRLRLARQVSVLEWQDLRLRNEEAAALAVLIGVAGNDRHDNDLHDNDRHGHEAATRALIDRLHEQSQGWAAGLVLLVERLRQSGALQSEAFAGSLESVFEYFAGQVFNANSTRIQDTLMRLSFLPRMNANHATAISGDESAEHLLADLARRNLFVDRRLGVEISYQFHGLFRTFLQSRAHELLGATEYQRCASLGAGLMRASGQTEGALRLYLDGSDWPAACSLILECAESLIQTGRHQTLADWIQSLPKTLHDEQAWLVYWNGVAIIGSDPAKSRVLIERALAGFVRTADAVGQVRAIASLMSGWWAERSSLHWLEPYASRLNELLEDDQRFDVRSRALGFISLARARVMIRPDDPALAHYARRLAALLAEDLSPELVVGVGTCLIAYYWGVGDSEAGTAVARRTRPAAERSDVPVTDRLWFWFYLLTHLVYLADAEAGRDVMNRARELNDESGLSPPFVDFIRWGVTFELQHGRPLQARQMIERELLPIVDGASLFTQACVDLEQARCAIEEERLGDALAHAQRAVNLCDEGGLGWLRASLGLTLACAQALAGRIDDADQTLQWLRAHVGENLPILSASIEAYQCLVDLKAGRIELARLALDTAMHLRSVTTYPWGPGWNRPGIARIAAFALQEGRHVTPMCRIVTALRITPPSADIEHWPWAVRIKVLDGFSLQVADQPLQVGSGKAAHRLLELLKALAARGGDAVPADELADMVWPEAEGDNARRSLDTALSRLRKLLRCEAAVMIHDGKVSLHPHWVSLDFRAFAYQVRQMHERPAGSEPWTRAARRAIAHYRRPLLADERQTEWLIRLRESARRQWLRIVRELVQSLEAKGDRHGARVLQMAAEIIDPEFSRLPFASSSRT